jgi:hypothetical protein
MKTPEDTANTGEESHTAIIRSLKSPLSVFGLAMLVCNAVFSMAAAFMKDLDAFIYSVHTFLAIVFAFIAIAIWSPRSLYHPAELAGVEQEVPEGKHSKLIITLIILLSGFSYAGYQMYRFEQERSGTSPCLAPSGAGTVASSDNRWQADVQNSASETRR